MKLENTTYKVLKLLYRKEQCKFDEIQAITGHEEGNTPSKYISALVTAGYIVNWDSDAEMLNETKYKPLGYEITLTGRAYIEDCRRNVAQFWVPYLLTTFLAVLSLIVSIVQFCHPCP